MHGRPLRFLALVLGAWVAVRVALLWPVGTAREAALLPVTQEPLGPLDLTLAALPTTTPVLPSVAAAPSPAALPPREGALPSPSIPDNETALVPAPRLPGAGRVPVAVPSGTTRSVRQPGLSRPGPGSHRRTREERLRLALEPAPTDTEQVAPGVGTPPVLAAQPPAPAPSAARLRLDAWLIARPGGSGDSLAFGQLGASQAGLRFTYAFDRDRRLALSARATAPFSGIGREAALGLDWRPTSLPVHLLVEERLPLDGGPARPAAQLIAGGAARLPLGFAIEGYAQAGGVYRRGGFADGSARLTRVLAARGWFAADLGVGGWGAAQRGVSRLDVGPTLGLTLPVGRGAVRLAVDYRRRVAGRARPGSGPVLSLGAGF